MTMKQDPTYLDEKLSIFSVQLLHYGQCFAPRDRLCGRANSEEERSATTRSVGDRSRHLCWLTTERNRIAGAWSVKVEDNPQMISNGSETFRTSGLPDATQSTTLQCSIARASND